MALNSRGESIIGYVVYAAASTEEIIKGNNIQMDRFGTSVSVRAIGTGNDEGGADTV